MNFYKNFELWRTNSFFDENTRSELNKLEIVKDSKEIEDRFYKDLEFGTGGLRGVMAAGTNRMNKYTVGKITTGLGRYLMICYTMKECRTRGVAVAYDTRKNSENFAEITAGVLTAMNIKVYMFTKARPTPQLSFSVKYLNCIAGVVITASHNSKEYNGYKIYDEFGCQLLPRREKQLTKYINAVDDYTKIVFSGHTDLIKKVDTTDAFIAAVMKQSLNKNRASKEALHIIYTPLHGTGDELIRRTLKLDGFINVSVVPEQEILDGEFSTVHCPNPENRDALALGIAMAREANADIILGTDPDCDRVGVAIKTKNCYQMLTGNQIGALLVDYVLNYKDLSNLHNPAVIRTVVTSELGTEIAKKRGLAIFSTLTGFKYIGEKITEFEIAKEKMQEIINYTFILGYEESNGYLVGTHTKDKDAVAACLLLCEMAAFYKMDGKTLLSRMKEIYSEYGYYRDDSESYTLKGKDGTKKIKLLMKMLRTEESPFEDIDKVIDYNKPVQAEPGFGTLPISDIIKYILLDGSWVAIRPSGTEPKIKLYYSIKGTNKTEVEIRLAQLKTIMKKTLELG